MNARRWPVREECLLTVHTPGLNIYGSSAAMLYGLTQNICILIILINNEQILTSMLAAGIVQDTFAGEAGEGEGSEEEMTRGYFYRSGWKCSVS